MASSRAQTVARYLADLPAERRLALQVVRAVILENLPPGFEEGMQFGMIGYYLPLSRYPHTYNGQALPLCALAAQKNHLAVYLMNVYGDPETRRWFERAYRASGKRLDMGKSCLRFRRVDDLALDVVGQAIGRPTARSFIAHYEAARGRPRKPGPKTRTKTKTKTKTKTRATTTPGPAMKSRTRTRAAAKPPPPRPRPRASGK